MRLCEIMRIEAWRSTQENPISGDDNDNNQGEHAMSLILRRTSALVTEWSQ
jgi:hypothetical protein